MISMDVKVIIFFAVILTVIFLAMYVGYQMGKSNAGFTNKEEKRKIIVPHHYHSTEVRSGPEITNVERDPWDEQRIDLPDKPKVIQTLPQEERNA